jgi:hypothetical protein
MENASLPTIPTIMFVSGKDSVFTPTSSLFEQSDKEQTTQISASPTSTNDAYVEISSKETNSDIFPTGKRKKVRQRIVRKLKPSQINRPGLIRRRKRFRSNKLPGAYNELNSQLDGQFPLHSVKKDINIYNSYGNRAVYYRIYNGNTHTCHKILYCL